MLSITAALFFSIVDCEWNTSRDRQKPHSWITLEMDERVGLGGNQYIVGNVQCQPCMFILFNAYFNYKLLIIVKMKIVVCYLRCTHFMPQWQWCQRHQNNFNVIGDYFFPFLGHFLASVTILGNGCVTGKLHLMSVLQSPMGGLWLSILIVINHLCCMNIPKAPFFSM